MSRIYKLFPACSGTPYSPGILLWAREHFPVYCFLNSNGFSALNYSSLPAVYALGAASTCLDDGTDAFSMLKEYADRNNDWLFGFLAYDLKNQLERLHSSHPDGIEMPGMHFFQPVVLIMPGESEWMIGCLPGFGPLSDPENVYEQVLKSTSRTLDAPDRQNISLKARVPRSRYLKQLMAIKEHILRGDIYELNYCVEFYADGAGIDPVKVYDDLNRLSPTPFSCLYGLNGKTLICASPERFLRKQGSRIVSQPIKGTIARGEDPLSDTAQRNALFNDPKERSENVMIVDLVRNDLSKTATDGSVGVEELCGIYPFSHVFQMISTVVSEIKPGTHFVDVIRHAFPMGSMTGAPKVKAMQLIEAYEDTKRGLYSGAVGYISPEKDFDFNVVIRSILHNADTNYLSYMAGSAITSGSVPEKEYQECLLKAETMRRTLIGGPQHRV